MVDKLLIPRHTIVWSLNAGYLTHEWDGTPDPLAFAAQAMADWRENNLGAGGGVAIESGTGCIYGDAEIIVNRGGNGTRMKLRDVVARFNGDDSHLPARRWASDIPTFVQREGVDGTVRLARLLNAWCSGEKTTFTVTTHTGRQIRATDEHPFLAERGWLRLDELLPGDLVHVRGERSSGTRQRRPQYAQRSGLIHHPFASRRDATHHAFRYPLHRLVAEAQLNGMPLNAFLALLRGDVVHDGLLFLDPALVAVHHRDGDEKNNVPENLEVLSHEEHRARHVADWQRHVLYKIALERVVSVERFGIEVTYDLEVADDPHNFLANGFVVHNTGKSYIVAAICLWFLACFEDAQVFTFAPTASQLRLYIWRYITEFWPRFVAHFPTASLTTETLRIRGGTNDTWAMHPKPVAIKSGEDISTRAAGMHAPHMLLVYEETPGIDPSVIMAGRNTCGSDHNLRLAIGNPNHKLDALHRMSEEPNVIAVRCSSLDHPNVVNNNPDIIPGAISLRSVVTRREQFGETDPIYLSRVRGIAPDQAANALIRLEWLKRSDERWRQRRSAAEALDDSYQPEISLPRSITAPKEVEVVRIRPLTFHVTGKGVDVANSEHGDERCICDFSENAVVRLETAPCPDSNALGRQVCREMDEHGTAPERVGIDATGVGAGTVNECRARNKPVMAIMFGGKPMEMAELLPDGQRYEWTADVNKFLNLRAQMYWQLREDLRKGVIDVQEDADLWEELTVIQWTDEPKTKIEAKDDIRSRIGRSPDKSDALVMGNWVRPRAVVPDEIDVPSGRSLGVDPDTGQPRERETADEMVDRMLGAVNLHPLANRYTVPPRRLQPTTR